MVVVVVVVVPFLLSIAPRANPLQARALGEALL